MSIETPAARDALVDLELDAIENGDRALSIDDATADLLFREAHTTNNFSDEPVGDEAIAAAWDLVRWGPTAMNTLPLRLLVVRSGDARERLVAHMSEGNKAKTLAAPLTIVAAADPGFHRHLGTLVPHKVGATEEFEPLVEVRKGMAHTSSLIQIGYLIVGLRAAGLAVGPMTGFDAGAIDGEFFTENGWGSLVVLNVGRPAEEDAHRPRAPRLDFDQIATLA